MPTGEAAAFVSLADLLLSRPAGPEAFAPQALRPQALPDEVPHAARPLPNAPHHETAPAPCPDPSPDDGSVAAPPSSEPVSFPASYELTGHPAALREARLFCAAVADALDVRVADLVRALAVNVLGRELLLAPADIESVVRALVAEHLADGPLRLRVAPVEAQFAFELPVIADPGLQPGDAILECCDGEIDARLQVRLERVIREVRA